MKVRVHNANEAKALVKEWNTSGQFAGENIKFLAHSDDVLVGMAMWKENIQEHELTLVGGR